MEKGGVESKERFSANERIVTFTNLNRHVREYNHVAFLGDSWIMTAFFGVDILSHWLGVRVRTFV